MKSKIDKLKVLAERTTNENEAQAARDALSRLILTRLKLESKKEETSPLVESIEKTNSEPKMAERFNLKVKKKC